MGQNACSSIGPGRCAPASFTTQLSSSAAREAGTLNTTASISTQKQTQVSLMVGAVQSMVTEMKLMPLYIPGKSVCYTSLTYSQKMFCALNDSKVPGKRHCEQLIGENIDSEDVQVLPNFKKVYL